MHQSMQHSMGVGYITEQPGTSLMPHHPRQVRLRQLLGDEHCTSHLWMAGYGAPSAKPTRCWGNARYVYQLANTLSWEEKRKLASLRTESTYFISKMRKALGEPHIYGNKKELKQSQEYPRAYATKVAKSWESWRARKKREIIRVEESDSEDDLYDAISTDPWIDAGMDRVAKDLGLPLDRLTVSR